MRIGIIAPPWIPIPPTAYGGIESFIDTLARALHDAGQDVVLAASDDSTSPGAAARGLRALGSGEDGGDGARAAAPAASVRRALADVDVIVDNTLAGPIIAKAATTSPS